MRLKIHALHVAVLVDGLVNERGLLGLDLFIQAHRVLHERKKLHGVDACFRREHAFLLDLAPLHEDGTVRARDAGCFAERLALACTLGHEREHVRARFQGSFFLALDHAARRN
jgi:hypothetical protein